MKKGYVCNSSIFAFWVTVGGIIVHVPTNRYQMIAENIIFVVHMHRLIYAAVIFREVLVTLAARLALHLHRSASPWVTPHSRLLNDHNSMAYGFLLFYIVLTIFGNEILIG